MLILSLTYTFYFQLCILEFPVVFNLVRNYATNKTQAYVLVSRGLISLESSKKILERIRNLANFQ